MNYRMEHPSKTAHAPLLLSVISTSLAFLFDQKSIDAAVAQHMRDIDRLTSMSDSELAQLGITRDQITAYVLSGLDDLDDPAEAAA